MYVLDYFSSHTLQSAALRVGVLVLEMEGFGVCGRDGCFRGGGRVREVG